MNGAEMHTGKTLISPRNLFLIILALLLGLFSSVIAAAQGCVAAHSNQRPVDELLTHAYQDGHPSGPNWLHKLTLNVGYRFFNSNKYFIGTQEIARPNAVRNHQNIFDVGVDFKLTPRWSIIADVPIFDGSRNQIYPPSGIFRVAGAGDLTVGAQAWVWRPPTESNGNVAFNVSLKIPTGINDAKGSALLKGKTIIATADQSMQPGDGGWGLLVGSQAFKQIPLKTMTYFQGQWLFSQGGTNGVPTFRSQPGQGLMAIADQYLFRAGISHGVPKIRHLELSLGIRDEGVPAHNLLSSSAGFRRPGYVVSLDPGLVFSHKQDSISVNGPWALARNREPSAPELLNGTKNGDAFFADYTVVVGLSHHF
jgi:hypothetical protein